MSKQKQQDNEMVDNDLVSYLETKVGHLKPYWSHITLAVCLVVLAIIGSFYLMEQTRAAEASKWRDVSIAFQNYRNTTNNESLKQLAEELPDDKAGMWSLIYAADAEVRSGLNDFLTDRNSGFDKLKKAQGFYQQILDSKADVSPMLQRRATLGLAYAYESSGDFNNAEKYYQQIVDLGEESPFYEGAKRGVERSTDSELIKLFDKFRNYEPPIEEEAPGEGLPQRPDISFPEGNEQPDSGGGDFSTPSAVDENEESSDATLPETGNDEDEGEGADSNETRGSGEDSGSDSSDG